MRLSYTGRHIRVHMLFLYVYIYLYIFSVAIQLKQLNTLILYFKYEE